MRNLPKLEKGKKKERQRKESGGGGGGGQQRSDSEASSTVSGDGEITEASRKSASSGIKDLDPVVEEEADN